MWHYTRAKGYSKKAFFHCLLVVFSFFYTATFPLNKLHLDSITVLVSQWHDSFLIISSEYCNCQCLILHLGNNIGIGVSASSNLFINHASCIPSLSCLPFFLYHPYMPLFARFLMYILVPLILYYNVYLCERGRAPCKN